MHSVNSAMKTIIVSGTCVIRKLALEICFVVGLLIIKVLGVMQVVRITKLITFAAKVSMIIKKIITT